MRTASVIIGFLLLLLSEGSALAHPMLDRGVAQYEQADFGAAIQTFDHAARNADLSVEELLQLFEMRALVHHALSDSKSMREDLRRVASVRPSYKLSALAPPPVVRAFSEVLAAGEVVELRIEERSDREGRSMVASVDNVPTELVDHVTLNCTVGPDAMPVSKTSKGDRVSVPLPDRGSYDRCEATARTRQGGVLFRAFLGEPRFESDATDVFGSAGHMPYSDGASSRKRKRWPWFVAAAVVVVAGGVTAGVVASKKSGGGDQPVVGGATVSW